MAPEPVRAISSRFPLIVACLLLLLAAPAHAFRLVDWNVLNYPGTTGATRDPSYRVVLGPLGVDALITEEQTSAAGITEFLNNLNTMEPGQWAAAPFIDGNDTDCGLFYKPSRVQFLGQWAFYPNPAYLLRYVHVYRLRPVGYSSEGAEFRIYGMHLKASSGATNEADRLAEATGVRDSMNAMPPGTHAFACGDFNFYSGAAPGFLKMLESQLDNVGQLYDPLGLQGISWQDNTAMQYAWTQSTCGTGSTGCANGAATGGIDDRFDLILPTTNWSAGAGLALVPGSYVSVGNDGLHHNNSINDPPTIPEGSDYATALKSVSDHLPVRVDLILPPIGSVPASLAFGTVITGATATQPLAVSNAASVSDSLNVLHYAIAPDPGFTAPSGGLALPEGQTSADPIGMDTSTPGVKSGSLSLSTDDPDRPTFSVGVGGTVLRHAAASLDSLLAMSAGALDFGTQDSGSFAPLDVRVHNLGWDALQARLSVTGATITGGDGHFSIVGGFTPALLSGTGASWPVAFDPAGATPDSLYQATLAITSADEPLPGATAQGDLSVTLSAKLAGSGNTAVGDHAPTATTLYAPYPNPLNGSSTMRFDLARAGLVSLEVFDLSGRRTATLVHRGLEPGRYSVPWTGRADDGSALGAGLYFVRLSAPGSRPYSTRIAVIR